MTAPEAAGRNGPPRLWGVELVVSRVLLWSALSLTGVLLFLAVVAAVPLVLGSAGPANLVAPLVVAVTVLPLRGRLQHRIDHLIYGDGADPPNLLARLGDRIGELPPGPEGLQSLADTLRIVLRLGWVRIEADGIDVSSGRRRDAAVLTLPLPGGDAGALHAQPLPGQGLDRRTRTVLADVAGLVATVVRLAQSYAVLDKARAALAERRAEERRAVRRELHDGLGPALAGIGFGLAAVENLAGSPERARELLRELADDVRARAREVRALADSVSPPGAGETVDLIGALHRLARRFDSPQLRVTAALPTALALPDEQAEALYFIAAEAVSNAARHSGGESVSIRLRDTTVGAVLEVADDGTGIPAHAPAGVGMSSMQERSRGIGGSLTIRTSPTGTIVLATVGRHLPVGADSTGAPDARPRTVAETVPTARQTGTMSRGDLGSPREGST